MTTKSQIIAAMREGAANLADATHEQIYERLVAAGHINAGTPSGPVPFAEAMRAASAVGDPVKLQGLRTLRATARRLGVSFDENKTMDVVELEKQMKANAVDRTDSMAFKSLAFRLNLIKA